MEKLLTCQQVADRYCVSIKTVWEWIKEGKLGAVRAGGKKYMVPESDLKEFERKRRV